MIQILAVVANLAALAWLAYMLITYVPLTRELGLAAVIIGYPLLNLIALSGSLRNGKA
jgi:hypothetical protein